MKKLLIIFSVLSFLPMAQASSVCESVKVSYTVNAGFALKAEAGVSISDEEQATCIRQACDNKAVTADKSAQESLDRGCMESSSAEKASEIGTDSWSASGMDGLYEQ